MKKTYEKPVVEFESFQLSRQVMACTTPLNYSDTTHCETKGEGLMQPNIFTSVNESCLTIEDAGYCYTNSTTNGFNETMQLFTS